MSHQSFCSTSFIKRKASVSWKNFVNGRIFKSSNWLMYLVSLFPATHFTMLTLDCIELIFDSYTKRKRWRRTGSKGDLSNFYVLGLTLILIPDCKFLSSIQRTRLALQNQKSTRCFLERSVLTVNPNSLIPVLSLSLLHWVFRSGLSFLKLNRGTVFYGYVQFSPASPFFLLHVDHFWISRKHLT